MSVCLAVKNGTHEAKFRGGGRRADLSARGGAHREPTFLSAGLRMGRIEVAGAGGGAGRGPGGLTSPNRSVPGVSMGQKLSGLSLGTGAARLGIDRNKYRKEGRTIRPALEGERQSGLRHCFPAG